MRRVEHKIERQGDRVTIEGVFRNRFKQPASVSITTSSHDTDMLRQVIQGDAKEVSDTMYALAEIAWAMGWRPAGLAGTLGAIVQRYQIPKAE